MLSCISAKLSESKPQPSNVKINIAIQIRGEFTFSIVLSVVTKTETSNITQFKLEKQQWKHALKYWLVLFNSKRKCFLKTIWCAPIWQFCFVWFFKRCRGHNWLIHHIDVLHHSFLFCFVTAVVFGLLGNYIFICLLLWLDFFFFNG